MTPDYYLCDKCGAKTKQRLFISTGRDSQGSGSPETIGTYADLCESCLGVLLAIVLNKWVPGYEVNKNALEWIQRGK